MAQQMITLEEAAARLGISPEEMKKRLKTDSEFKKLSQIRDGSTVRFKVSAIDELARQLGMASEDGLPMAPLKDDTPGSDDFKVKAIDDPIKKTPRKPPAPVPAEEPLDFGNSDDDDVFSLAAEAPKSSGPKSSGRLTPPKSSKAPPQGVSDSSFGGSTDSDVRLDGGKAKKPKPDEAAVPTEEIALDFSGPGSAVIKSSSSAKLSAPKGGSSGKLEGGKSKGKLTKPPVKPPVPNDSSEFELSLDADSSDFDLQLNADSGDEVDLGSLPKDKAGSSNKRGSHSGINLSDPADDGISLEKGGKTDKTDKKPKETAARAKKPPPEDSDASDMDFELSLDSSAAASNTKLGAPKSGKLVLDSDSDSEFELTLDDSNASLEQAALEQDILDDSEDKGDIFETDFEIPQMPDESASEAVALESDTDLEQSDSELEADGSDVAAEEGEASEVVLLEDEEEGAPPAKGKARPKPAKGKKKPAGDDVDVDVDVDLADDSATDEDDGSAAKALKGAKGKKRTDDDDEAVPAGAGAPTKPWGIVPLLFLAPALLFTLVGALMGFEMLQTMWGYQQPRKPSAPIVRAIASQLDMELKDQ